MKRIGITLVSGLALSACAVRGSDELQSSSSLSVDSERAQHETCLEEAAAQHITSIALEGQAVDFPNHGPLRGIHVCVENRDGSNAHCGDTAANGRVSLEVAPCNDIRVTYEAAGYFSVNQLLRVATTSVPIGTRVLTVAQAQTTGDQIGVPFDASKARPAVTMWTPDNHPLSGVSLGMTPASGTAYYVDANGVASASLTATSSWGVAGRFNADAGGSSEVTATATGKSCAPAYAVPGHAANSAVVELRAGSMGEAIFYCH
jgi:hypothetical protein